MLWRWGLIGCGGGDGWGRGGAALATSARYANQGVLDYADLAKYKLGGPPK